jgi:hypothetical protein
MRIRLPTYIVAGSHQEFQDYLEAHPSKFAHAVAIYFDGPEVLRHLTSESKILLVGSYIKLPLWPEIVQEFYDRFLEPNRAND